MVFAKFEGSLKVEKIEDNQPSIQAKCVHVFTTKRGP